MNIKDLRKGFTLIELLVVIAIIAVLAVVVILTLNPAELLRQARDSNRISDLGTAKSAISLFQADVSTSSVSAIGLYGTLYANSNAAEINNAKQPYANYTSTLTTGWGWGFATLSVPTGIVTSTSRNVNGTGWMPINFNAISSGAPISNEPVDPTNSASNTYAYVASSTSFKISTKVESTKYSNGGTSDVASTDGGTSAVTFESGTKLAL